jgi:branched-chain amino acid transport system ATP-binding protein
VQAVRGIDLSVSDGEIFVLLGANGAGKSSTLRALAGVIGRRGRVQWDGRNLSRARSFQVARSGLTLVPEGRRIFSPLTVEENLRLGGYARGGRRWMDEELERVYTMFPILKERRSGKAGLLSGGEQQMLAFGRALMSSPRLIMMDEPSTGLAPAIVDVVMDKVREIASTGIAVLMVEQNAAVALAIADRAAVLERGLITAQGTADEMRHNPAVLRAFLGDKAESSLASEIAADIG